jgi:hypothetical protein
MMPGRAHRGEEGKLANADATGEGVCDEHFELMSWMQRREHYCRLVDMLKGPIILLLC